MNQQLLDRATEWVGVNFPDLDAGAEWESKVAEAIEDIQLLDAETDQSLAFP